MQRGGWEALPIPSIMNHSLSLPPTFFPNSQPLLRTGCPVKPNCHSASSTSDTMPKIQAWEEMEKDGGNKLPLESCIYLYI